MGTGPMYCPYGGGLCQHAAIERCGAPLSNLIECKVFWEREHASEQFDIGPPKPTSPPEMPPVDPVCLPPLSNPIVLGYCVRYEQKVGKKEAGTCVGCTVGCPGKGKQEPGLPGHSLKGSDMEYDKILQQGPPSPPETLECKVIGCYDLNKTGTCMRVEGPCERQVIP